jgi:hypothetical protein
MHTRQNIPRSQTESSRVPANCIHVTHVDEQGLRGGSTPSNGGAGGWEGACIDRDESISVCNLGGGGVRRAPGNAGSECHAQEGAEGGRVGEHCRVDGMGDVVGVGVECHGHGPGGGGGGGGGCGGDQEEEALLPGHGAVLDQSHTSHSPCNEPCNEPCNLHVRDYPLISWKGVEALQEEAAGKLRLEEEWTSGVNPYTRTQGAAGGKWASLWDRFPQTSFGTWWPWPAIGKNVGGLRRRTFLCFCACVRVCVGALFLT